MTAAQHILLCTQPDTVYCTNCRPSRCRGARSPTLHTTLPRHLCRGDKDSTVLGFECCRCCCQGLLALCADAQSLLEDAANFAVQASLICVQDFAFPWCQTMSSCSFALCHHAPDQVGCWLLPCLNGTAYFTVAFRVAGSPHCTWPGWLLPAAWFTVALSRLWAAPTAHCHVRW